ncbi:MAG: twin-arginine translocation signal domain-containing protein [Anaerolineae bacterium]|nr:twin-arginine translocation signal domain-containing protein [Anaerolineae bacterium]
MINQLSRRNFLRLSAAGTVGLALAGSPLAAFGQDGIRVRYVTPQWASTRDRRSERQIAFRSVIDLFNAQYPHSLEEIVGTGDPVGISQNLDNDEADAYWVENPGMWTGKRKGALRTFPNTCQKAKNSSFSPLFQNTCAA